jgi:hypothetical protein
MSVNTIFSSSISTLKIRNAVSSYNIILIGVYNLCLCFDGLIDRLRFYSDDHGSATILHMIVVRTFVLLVFYIKQHATT